MMRQYQISNEWVQQELDKLNHKIYMEYLNVNNPQPVDWDRIFKERPDLKPIGYEEAVAEAKAKTEARYAIHGKKRAKGSNARKSDQVSRKGLQEKERRAKFPSLKHSAD